MNDKNEKKIIQIIRYAPPLFIVLVTILATIFMNIEHKKQLQTEKQFIKLEHEKAEKDRVKKIVQRATSYIEDQEKYKKIRLQKHLKEYVENAYNIVNSIYEKNKNIKSKNEIVKLIKDSLRQIRFLDGRGYFFIYELRGKNILNAGFPKIEGKNFWNYKDPHGNLIFQEMYKNLEYSNEVYYDWVWNKPEDRKKKYKKVGFFKKFEPYGWFIGTGEYIDDFTKTIKKETLTFLSKLKFKNNGYVFVVKKDGTLLSSINKAMVGLNVNNNEPEKPFANKINRFIDSKVDNGFIDYYVYKSLSDKAPKYKISYVQYIDNWEWIIGSGFNVGDINKTILRKQDILEKEYDNYLKQLITINLVLIIILIVLSAIVSKYLEKVFFTYKKTLKDKNDKLLKAQEIAMLADWELKVESNETIWSKEIFKIFELKNIDEEIGLNLLKKIIHKDDWNNFEQALNFSIKNETEHRCTYRIYTPNKRIKWIDCRGEFDKEEKRILGTIQDITDIKMMQVQKEKNEKLLYQQSKMAAMGEMLGNIAHQWRQPLSTISVAATGIKIQKEMNLLSDENLFETMDVINNSTQYLSQTIEDFRNFFDPKDSNVEEISLQEVIDKALNIVQVQFSSKDIEIIKNTNNIKIKTLANELIQVLVNILNNSRDALEEVDIFKQKRLIIITCNKVNNKVYIQIQDSGKGVDESIIDRIFEPYFTTKHKSQGTGIGLYMAQEIVTKLLYGQIKLKNRSFGYEQKEYLGAFFEIELPEDIEKIN